MKKYISVVIAVLTILFCFASCGKEKKIYTDISEYDEAVSKSQIEASVSESKQVEDIANDKVKTEKEIGKSTEGEKLVLRRDGSNSVEYWVLYFKNGKADYRVRYIYCYDDTTYQSKLQNIETGKDKITDSDANLRCIVVKTTGIMASSYSSMYNYYTDSEVFTII